MNIYRKNNYKIGLKEIILGMSFLTPAFGTLDGILPINLYQILILLLGFMLLIENIVKRKSVFVIPRFSIYLFLYIGFITFILNYKLADFDSIKTFGITFLYTIIFFSYVRSVLNIETIFYLIYNIAFILSLIGLIQEFGYIVKNPLLYDFTYIGITYNIPVGSSTAFGNLARIQSIYSEPSHLALILGLSCMMILFKYIYPEIFKFTSNKKSLIIILCSLLTFSTLIYIILMVCIMYILFVDKTLLCKKYIYWISIIVILIFGIYYFGDWLENMFIKLQELFIKDNQDKYSAFALTSNLKIAIEKLKDGYLLGTGIDSHRLLYYNYINNLYSNVEIYLNYDEAGSMYIRILSEFGIIGIVFFVGIILKELFLINKSKIYKERGLYYYQRTIIIVLFVYLVRNGRYMDNLMFLSIMLLYEMNRRAKLIIN